MTKAWWGQRLLRKAHYSGNPQSFRVEPVQAWAGQLNTSRSVSHSEKPQIAGHPSRPPWKTPTGPAATAEPAGLQKTPLIPLTICSHSGRRCRDLKNCPHRLRITQWTPPFCPPSHRNEGWQLQWCTHLSVNGGRLFVCLRESYDLQTTRVRSHCRCWWLITNPSAWSRSLHPCSGWMTPPGRTGGSFSSERTAAAPFLARNPQLQESLLNQLE